MSGGRPTKALSPYRTEDLAASLLDGIEPDAGVWYMAEIPRPWSSSGVPPQGWGAAAGRSSRPVRVLFEEPTTPASPKADPNRTK